MADAPATPVSLFHPAPSPLLQLPGAVAGSGVDATVAWHYGDPIGEQRKAERAVGLVDRSHREILTVTGPDRHDWLNKLTSQLLLPLADGTTTEALVLSPNGHVEHHLGVTELDGTVYLDTEPGRGATLLKYLEMMKFWTQVDIAASDLRQLSVIGPKAAALFGADAPAVGQAVRPDSDIVRRTAHAVDVFTTDPAATAHRLIAAGAYPTGGWADDALRIPTRRPRIGVDTDDRTIPNEVSWLDDAVHLHKGCYRGQETVARVANLGRPPRRLVMLNLDGSQDLLPAAGDPVTLDGRTVGRVGTVSHHHDDGPIALALVKRSIGSGAALLAGVVDARVDPADDAPADAPPPSRIDRAAFAAIHRN